ncbi:hypothetical protein ACE38W_12270 [Chitinophaga sp. Hz27]|uniref:hypothetical protein n=1 Tax=Chitinophaga sp. Hz27 TaxID=3347169 RepID=UPI0035D5D884
MHILLFDPDLQFTAELVKEINPHFHKVQIAANFFQASTLLVNHQIDIVAMAKGSADMSDKLFIDMLKHRKVAAIVYHKLFSDEEKKRYQNYGAYSYCSKDSLYILGELVSYKNHLLRV